MWKEGRKISTLVPAPGADAMLRLWLVPFDASREGVCPSQPSRKRDWSTTTRTGDGHPRAHVHSHTDRQRQMEKERTRDEGKEREEEKGGCRLRQSHLSMTILGVSCGHGLDFAETCAPELSERKARAVVQQQGMLQDCASLCCV